MANTPTRSFRCPPEIWERAQKRAKEEGTSVSSVLKDFIIDYAQPVAFFDKLAEIDVILAEANKEYEEMPRFPGSLGQTPYL